MKNADTLDCNLIYVMNKENGNLIKKIELFDEQGKDVFVSSTDFNHKNFFFVLDSESNKVLKYKK